MTPCGLVSLGFLLALCVIVWLIGKVRALQREIERQRMVGRVLHERRVEEP